MASIATELPFSKPLRVAIHFADPQRRKLLSDALRMAGLMVVELLTDAEVVLSDDEMLTGSRVPSVILGEAANAAGLLPLNASFEQIEAALRAVAAGLVVRPRRPAGREFWSQSEIDENALLTPRELQVLDLIAAGLTNKGIARQLGISLHTIKFHVESLFRKLGARTRTEAVAKALERRRAETIII